MKSISSLLFALAFIPGMANAIPIIFTNTAIFSATDVVDSVSGTSVLDGHGGVGDVNFIASNADDYVSWTHSYGFDPSMGTITDASITLLFADDFIDNPFSPGESVMLTYESGLGIGIQAGPQQALQLQSQEFASLYDGDYSFTLAHRYGDTYINEARLTIAYEPVAMPEPSSWLLVAVGLAGFGLIGRRRAMTA